MRSVVALATLLLSSSAWASAAAVYVAQAQAGTGDGSSCANAKAVSFFNTGASWGAGAAQIGPGTTVGLCGTITTALVVGGSGTNGTPITIAWQPGASLTACSTNGALQLGSRSYLLVDLGGNGAAITCANNGTGLGTQTIAQGIGGNTPSHVEVKNGTIGPIYQYSGTGPDGVGSMGVTFTSGGNNHYHDLTFTDANQGFYVPLAGTTSGDEFDHITMSKCGQGIWYALGSSGTITGAKIHDWDVTYGANWAVPGDYTHTEVVHLFTQDAANNNLSCDIYNLYVHGSRPTSGYTADLFVDGSTAAGHGTITANIFNNLLVSSANGFPGDGAIFVAGAGNTVGIYNNTVDCGSKTVDGIATEYESAGSTYNYANNIFLHCKTAAYSQGAGPTLTAANDLYFDVGSGGWYYNGANKSTLAAWQTASGQDSGASTADPGLAADDTISGAGSLAAAAGKNLSSLNIAALGVGKPLVVGRGGGTGAARPASGAWSAGAYEYCVGSACGVTPDLGMASDGDGGVTPGDDGGSIAGGDDAGRTADTDGGSDGATTSHGCDVGHGSAAPLGALLMLIAIVLLRRRGAA